MVITFFGAAQIETNLSFSVSSLEHNLNSAVMGMPNRVTDGDAADLSIAMANVAFVKGSFLNDIMNMWQSDGIRTEAEKWHKKIDRL